MSEPEKPAGPDLTQGVPVSEIPEQGVLAGQVGEDKVLLARVEGGIVAVSGACTHYSGPLEKGLRVGDTIRCPWHHACFSLKTGAALEAPALSPLDCWKVKEKDGVVTVTESWNRSNPPHPRRLKILNASSLSAAGRRGSRRLSACAISGIRVS